MTSYLVDKGREMKATSNKLASSRESCRFKFGNISGSTCGAL